MLKRALGPALWAATVLGVAVPRPALGAKVNVRVPSAEVPSAIAEPVRLTAGASSELMGVSSPDEAALYFVSDANGTLDIDVQAPVQSGPVTLSGGLGDAAWPQVSPNGKHLAYISFASDSTGDACVRPISKGSDSKEGDGTDAGPEKCLTNSDSAELQVLWWDDASLAVLSRRELHGDFRLERVPIDGGKPTTLLARNMVGLAISPDRRWLAYIPLDKAARDVGVTFSQRVAVGIRLQRLGGDAPSAKAGGADTPAPLEYLPRLPGVTGYVAFSGSGDFLEFTQFLNDTNRDGTIDGDDNAVIFRVPFHGERAVPISAEGEPEQLTSARWDCHYPAPAKSHLIASCSHGGSLDIYSLPLTGAVPRTWDDARLSGEIAFARDLWTQLLLSSRRLALADSPGAKEAIVLDMMALHLELGEYESTIYYAENRLQGSESQRWGHVIAELARHRRADLALIRGETSEQYIRGERARVEDLKQQLSGASPRVVDLVRLVQSEIDDDVGDKAAALSTFRELQLEQLSDPTLVSLAARRAERLYRLRGDRQSLLDAYRVLAGLPALDVAHRLEYAQRFVSELGRGQTRPARAAALVAWRGKLDDDSELALLLDVERILATLDDKNQEEVRAQIFTLYTQNKDLSRRRALVLATLRAAATAGNEYLQYQFVNSWASWLDKKHPERKYAETLYKQIVLDRAYGEGRQGNVSESRGYFYGATLNAESLEAHIGFIEARLAEAGADAVQNIDDVYAKRFARDPDSPVYAFVKAYRIARELPREADAARHERAVSQVIDYLARALEQLPKEAQIHQLWGFALHQRARRSGSREAAVAANRQYLLALDLAQNDERLTAALLHRLGLLQASLGSYGSALRYLQRREELPHVRPLEELDLRIAIAQSAWHRDDAGLAIEQLLTATQLVAATPALARYEPLVVDRLGLSLSAGGQAAAATSRYQELEGLLERDAEASPLNRLKARVGLAASALQSGDAATAIGALTRADELLDQSSEIDPKPAVVWRKPLVGGYRYTRLQYRAMVAGLRTSADRAAGNYPAALEASQRRVQLLEKRLEESGADEDVFELAQAYHQLARLSYHMHDMGATRLAVERGLELCSRFNENTGSEVNDAELALIRDYAELHLYGGVPLDELQADLGGRLRRAYAVICKYRNPRWARQRFLFKSYLTELALSERL